VSWALRARPSAASVHAGGKAEQGILFLAEAPTQWQAPLFRYLASLDTLTVRTAFRKTFVAIDPELGHPPGWGDDLLSGYDWVVQPGDLLNWTLWVWRVIRDEQWRVYVVPGWSSLWARTFLACGVILGIRRRLIIFTDSTNMRRNRRFKDWVRSLVLRMLSVAGVTFAVPGQLAKQHLLALGIAHRHLLRLPYAIDNDRFGVLGDVRERGRLAQRVQWGVGPEDTVLLCIAKFSPREGPEDTVTAFCSVAPAWPNSQLVVVGDGPERSLVETAAGRYLGTRVRLVGYVAYGDLPHCYWAADAFVHLPRSEPWGLSLNEAAAAGLPIITSSRVGASVDLVERGTGYVTDGTIGDAARAMETFLAQSPTDRETMGRHSRTLGERVSYAHWAEALTEVAPSGLEQ